jgi:5-methyltetrahydropteroyltriglutamate--homocysteine methyltransferase
MKRSTDRILRTHVGSLARPPGLADASRNVQTPEEWRRFKLEQVQPAIAEVLRKQAEARVDIVSDGELGKGSRNSYHSKRFDGVTIRPLRQGEAAAMREQTNERLEFSEFYGTGQGGARGQERMVASGPVTYAGAPLVEADIAAFKGAISDTGLQFEEAFMCDLAPGWLEHFLFNEHYDTTEEFLFAVADAWKQEYRAIADAGFLIQLDDPALATKYDMLFPQPSIEEYRKVAALRVEAVNYALEGIPEDRVRYHMCWGSWHGPHTHDIPLTDLVDLMLEVKAGAYSIEAGNPRHQHEWKVWKDVKLPDGKILIPGVVSHASNVVEHPELVADRIVQYANVVGRENVIAGTDCGMGGRVHEQIGWTKLAVLAEGAELATKRLWARS